MAPTFHSPTVEVARSFNHLAVEPEPPKALSSRPLDKSAAERRAAATVAVMRVAESHCSTPLRATTLETVPVPDAKHVLLLRDPTGEPRAVAQISSTFAPDMLARGVARADAIRKALQPAQAAPIVAPFAKGRAEGLSYAIWPYCTPFSKLGGNTFARWTFAMPVLAWLRQVTQQTVRPVPAADLGDRIDRPLCRLASNARVSSRARLAARSALQRLDSGRWRPMEVAQHSDMYIGNLLFDHNDATQRAHLPWNERFVVIDWCGATLRGQPLYDLLRIAESMCIPHAVLHRELQSHLALLDSPLDDAPAFATAALAALGMELEHMPVELYAQLIDRAFTQLDRGLAGAARRSA